MSQHAIWMEIKDKLPATLNSSEAESALLTLSMVIERSWLDDLASERFKGIYHVVSRCLAACGNPEHYTAMMCRLKEALKPPQDGLGPKEALIQTIKRTAMLSGSFTLKSGKESNVYIDMRRVSLSRPGVWQILTAMNETLEEKGVRYQAIAGPSIGSDPIIGAAVSTTVQYGFMVRPQTKGHGTGCAVEGCREELKEGGKAHNVLMVEDVTTTGRSVMTAAEKIQEEGGRIVAVVAILDRQEGAEELFKGAGYPFISLTTLADLRFSENP